jgi:hypothetical protein
VEPTSCWSNTSDHRKIIKPNTCISGLFANQSCFIDTQFIILSKRDLYHHDLEVNTLFEDIPQAKNVALHASSAKPFAQLRQSQSKRRSVQMEAGEPHGMIST